MRAIVAVKKAPVLSAIYEEWTEESTLQEIFDSFTGLSKDFTTITVNGEIVEDWSYTIKDGDGVIIMQQPGAVAGLSAAQLVWMAVISAVVGAVIGYLLYQNMEQGDPTSDEKKARVTGDRNQKKGYEPLPFILGKRKITPAYAAMPYFTYVGDDQYYTMLLHLGYGPLKVDPSLIKIGDVELSSFDDKDYAILDWYENKDPNSIRGIWSKNVVQNAPFVDIPRSDYDIDVRAGRYERTKKFVNESIPAGVGDITVVIGYPNGLYRINGKGERRSTESCFQFQYRDDNGKWLTVVNYSIITNRQTGLVGLQCFKESTDPSGPLYVTKQGIISDGIAGTKDFPRFTDDYSWNRLPQYTIEIPPSAIVIDSGSFGGGDGVHITGIGWAVIDESKLPAGYTVATTTLWSGTGREAEYRWAGLFPASLLRNANGDVMDTAERAVNVRFTNLRPLPPDEVVDGAQVYLLQRQEELTDEDFNNAIGRPSGDKRQAILALKMRASGQVSGNIETVNAVVESVVPSNFNSDWRYWYTNNLNLTPSNNPADLYKWVLQGPFNPAKVGLNKIDLSTLENWKATCTQEGWETSDLVNYEITLKNCLHSIAQTGRAEFSIDDGKFSVTEYKKRTIPVQIFTPKNSSNLSVTREYPEPTDGITVEFQNEELDWELDEWTYYDPEISAGKRTGKTEKIEFWGVSKPELAKKHARFAYLEKRYRRETFSFETDIEGLVCKRGDLIRLNNDIIKVGLGAGKIRQVEGNIRIDETINLVQGQVYGLEIRKQDGSIESYSSAYIGDGWFNMPPSGNVNVNDLVAYGEVGYVSYDCVVTEISYSDNLSCNIKAVNAANFIFDIDEGDPLPEGDTGIGGGGGGTGPIDRRRPDTPTIRTTQKYFDYSQSVIEVIVEKVGNVPVGGYTLQYKYDSDDSMATLPNTQWHTQYLPASENVFRIPVPENDGDIKLYLRAQSHGTGGIRSWFTLLHIIDVDEQPAPPAVIGPVTELVDTPKTPDGTRSTIKVEIIPPPYSIFFDKALKYSHAVLDYRKLNSPGTWFTYGTVGSVDENTAYIEVAADGTEYEIRVRSVSKTGFLASTSRTKTIRVTNVENPEVGGPDEEIPKILPVPVVTGLELFGEGNGTEFTGRDVRFTWRKSSYRSVIDFGNEGALGAEASRLDQYQFGYMVEIWADNNLARIEYVNVNSYTYTYEQNVQDYKGINGTTGAFRDIEIRVWAQGRDNQLSPRPAKLQVGNPPPDLPSTINVWAMFGSLTVEFTRPDDLDFTGVNVWVRTTTFDPSQSEPDFFATGNLTVGDLDGGTTYYVAIQPVDAFGSQGAPYSQVYEVTTLESVKPEDLSGWAYQIEPASRAFIEANIEDGAIDVSGNLITGQLQGINLADAAVDSDKLANLSVTAAKIVDGSIDLSGNKITGQLQGVNLADASVDSDKLANLSVTASKIADGSIDLSGNKITGQLQGVNLANASVDSDKLADLSVTAAKIVDGSIDLSGNKVTGQLQGINLADAAVDSSKLANLSVTAGKIVDGSIDLSGNKITGQLQGVNLADAAVDGDKLADLSVDAAKIVDGAITDSKVDVWLSGKSGTSFPTSPVDGQFFRRTDLDITYRYNIATNEWYAVDFLEAETRVGSAVIGSAAIIDAAISSAKIEDAAITSAKIEDLAVGTAAIANGAITNAKIGNAAVDTAQIADAAIESAKIADLAVGTAAIANGAITNAKIENLAVDTAKIQDAAIESAKIADLAVGTAAIANAAITNAKIGNAAVDTAQIADAAIESAKIADLAVGTAAIANGAITNAKIGNAAVDTAQINDAAITSAKIEDLAVGNAAIANGAITNAKIENLAVSTAKIEDAAIDTAKIADLAVTDAKIVDLTASKITAGVINATETITAEGLVRAVAPSVSNIQVEVGIGPYEKNPGEVNLLWAYNGNTEIFSIDENGNATFTGKITVTGGSSGVASFDDAGVLATRDSVDWDTEVTGSGKPESNATYGADWSTTLQNIPARIRDNATTGLNLTEQYMGYYDGTSFRTYIQSNGNFHFGGAGSNYISWDGSKLTLAISNLGSDSNATGINSIALGGGSSVSAGNSTAVGGLATVHSTSGNSVAIGSLAQVAAGSVRSVAVGNLAGTGTNGAESVAVGYSSRSDYRSVSIGSDSHADTRSVAIGERADSSTRSIAIGDGSASNGQYSIAIGPRFGADSSTDITKAQSQGAIAIGTSTEANSQNSTSVGFNAHTTGTGAVGIGSGVVVYGNDCIAIGNGATAGISSINPTRAVTIGAGISNSVSRRIAIGSSADDVHIAGSLNVSGTKNFKTTNPDNPAEWVVHSSYEGPCEGGTIYRYEVDAVDGTATIDLPHYFSALNKDVMVFCQADRHFGQAYGEIDDNICTITSNADGRYFVVIYGTRKDTEASSSWNGDVISKTREEIADMYYEKCMEKGDCQEETLYQCQFIKNGTDDEARELLINGEIV